jgi:hypothetical protein
MPRAGKVHNSLAERQNSALLGAEKETTVNSERDGVSISALGSILY